MWSNLSNTEKFFPQALSLKESWWPLIFISFLKQVNHYLSTVEVEKKTIERKILNERPEVKVSLSLLPEWDTNLNVKTTKVSCGCHMIEGFTSIWLWEG